MSSFQKSKNTEKKQKRQLSIQTSAFLSMLVLILVMIITLWFSQTILMSKIYEYIKKSETDTMSEIVSSNIESESINSIASTMSEKYGACVMAINVSNGEKIIDVKLPTECFIHKITITNELISTWREQAEKNGGYYVATVFNNNLYPEGFNPDDFIDDNYKTDGIISIRLTKLTNEDTVMIITNTPLAPISSVMRTLNVMLIVVTVFMVIIASIVAFYLAKKISSPLINMTKSAKKLAKGDYNVSFDSDGPIEAVELANTLNYTTSELSKLDKMQKELIANISHDLRTPLTMISGYSEIMRDIPSEITPENMQVIIDETAHLSSLVNDLLDISKLQSSMQKISIEKVNLTKTILSTIKRYDTLVKHSGYEISFDYDKEVYVNADEIRILQVIYNLINNAINYTGADKTVKISQIINGETVRISVTDTGKGIAKEDLPYIWDRYYKVDKVHTRATVGTGLGLSIVKSILILHGSRFGVSSEVDEGSTFWFELKTTDMPNDIL